MSNPDVLILGGGVIGLTTAHYLAGAGASVTVLDRAEFGRQASWAGAGIVPPGNLDAATDAYDRLRALSASLYPTLSQELRSATGIDNGYVVCGGLELVAPDEASPEAAWTAEGLSFQEVGPEELHRLEPDLAPGPGCVFFLPDLAQVRNPRHIKALLASCRARGVRLLDHCPALTLTLHGNRVVGVETTQGPLRAGTVLVAAGAWSDALLAQVGWRPGVRPLRGQIVLLQRGVGGLRPVVLQGKRYLVPRPDGHVLVGSTEEEAGYDARPTADGVSELLAFALRLMPSLGRALPERSWAGLRPISVDGLPYLGPVPGCAGLFVATGHGRAGLQLSPGTGLVAAALVLGKIPPLDVTAFRLDRPAAGPGQTAFRS
jgi:glycine oxidase